ncbi:hypothetical protein KM043_005585 [Ampulex compressa]|nr:hypothetical protein KM043_005585 [Ampulex compressa]
MPNWHKGEGAEATHAFSIPVPASIVARNFTGVPSSSCPSNPAFLSRFSDINSPSKTYLPSQDGRADDGAYAAYSKTASSSRPRLTSRVFDTVPARQHIFAATPARRRNIPPGQKSDSRMRKHRTSCAVAD